MLARRAPSHPIRVLVFDRVAVRSAFVREFLEQDPGIVVGEIDDGVKPDVVIAASRENSATNGGVVPAKVRRLARGAPILVLCDRDQRRVMPGRVVELPSDITPVQLREEVIAAAGRSSARRTGHLVLTRRVGQSVMIGDDVEITLLQVSRTKVRLGVSAPSTVRVLRRELWDQQRSHDPANRSDQSRRGP
jgi:carbon storage regulator